MNKNISKKLAKRKKKISKILNKRDWDEQPAPMFKASNIQYEIDGRLQGIGACQASCRLFYNIF
nr:hypothetical protein [uncultured Desulfobacter sp.]